MSALLSTRKVLRLGVANFDPSQLSSLLSSGGVRPTVHQFELHPYLQQTEFVQWHLDNYISVTAYSPLANLNPVYGSPGNDVDAPPSLLQDKQISEIAKKTQCTNAQVALAWGMSRGLSQDIGVIPKSQHADRIVENFESKYCALDDEDLEVFDAIGAKYKHRFNNPSESWRVPLFTGLDDGSKA